MQRVRQEWVDPTSRRRSGWRDVALGVVAGLLVLAAGAVLVVRTPPSYEASTSIVVLPDPSLTPQLVAGYYDTLSQGQVVNTFAEILRVRTTASELSAGARSSVTVQVVPNTAVIQITGRAQTAAAAADLADHVLSSTSFYVNQAYAPYRVALVHPAKGTAQRVGLGPLPVLAVVGLVAVVVGLAVQQAAHALGVATRLRTSRHPSRDDERPAEGQGGIGAALSPDPPGAVDPLARATR